MTENGTIKLAPESVIWKPDRGKAILTPGSAVAADLALGKTAWVNGVQLQGATSQYKPGGTAFDGVNSGYTGSVARTGNTLTAVCRGDFKTFLTATHSYKRIFQTANSQPSLYCYPSDHGTSPNKVVFLVRNTASSAICQLFSLTELIGSGPHSMLFAYDGDTGAATWIVDGVNADDTGHGSRTLTTGTLNTTQNAGLMIGPTDARPLEGSMTFVGYDDQYITDYSLFFDSNNMPIFQDTTNWASTPWGAQPLLWHPHGNLALNQGSASAFTATSIVGGSWEDLYP